MRGLRNWVLFTTCLPLGSELTGVTLMYMQMSSDACFMQMSTPLKLLAKCWGLALTLLLCNCELSTFAWGFHMTPRVCEFCWQVAWSQLKLVWGGRGGKKRSLSSIPLPNLSYFMSCELSVRSFRKKSQRWSPVLLLFNIPTLILIKIIIHCMCWYR